MPSRLKEYHKVFTGNVIAQNRMRNVGMLSKEDAVNYAITGPSGRGSNWSCDCRKKHPYSIYAELDFNEVLEDGCDSFADIWCVCVKSRRAARFLRSLSIRFLMVRFVAQVPKLIKLPEGRWYQQVEASRGVFGVYIESDGQKNPYRMRFRSRVSIL